ncbi:MAG: peroxiredoxin [Candidatus Amulumruptor caecigallinarius]|nr:peroxiredoxin [Candidatus Amulumruptor caecigallinarius]
MNIGDKFPVVLGVDSDGKEVKLTDFPGKKFIIYFYPKDNTSGCTLEAVSIRDNYQSFLDMGYQVIGVSKDSAASHCRFAEKHSLPFPLIADTDLKLCELAGVWQPKVMAGKAYMGIVRTTFVTDENGVVTDKIDKVKTRTAAEQLFSLLDNRDNPNPA